MLLRTQHWNHLREHLVRSWESDRALLFDSRLYYGTDSVARVIDVFLTDQGFVNGRVEVIETSLATLGLVSRFSAISELLYCNIVYG
jgi:hypothetical protein